MRFFAILLAFTVSALAISNNLYYSWGGHVEIEAPCRSDKCSS